MIPPKDKTNEDHPQTSPHSTLPSRDQDQEATVNQDEDEWWKDPPLAGPLSNEQLTAATPAPEGDWWEVPLQPPPLPPKPIEYQTPPQLAQHSEGLSCLAPAPALTPKDLTASTKPTVPGEPPIYDDPEGLTYLAPVRHDLPNTVTNPPAVALVLLPGTLHTVTDRTSFHAPPVPGAFPEESDRATVTSIVPGTPPAENNQTTVANIAPEVPPAGNDRITVADIAPAEVSPAEGNRTTATIISEGTPTSKRRRWKNAIKKLNLFKRKKQ